MENTRKCCDYYLNIVNSEREDYIDWLMVAKGYSKEDAESMADIMGYERKTKGGEK